MFKDQKEELKKLEDALLQETEEPEYEAPEEEYDPEPDEDPTEYFEPEVRNFTNRYGTPEAWNADPMDGDLEEFSREVYEGGRSGGLRWLGIAALLLSVAAVLGWLVLKQRGLLP